MDELNETKRRNQDIMNRLYEVETQNAIRLEPNSIIRYRLFNLRFGFKLCTTKVQGDPIPLELEDDLRAF